MAPKVPDAPTLWSAKTGLMLALSNVPRSSLTDGERSMLKLLVDDPQIRGTFPVDELQGVLSCNDDT